MLKPLLQSCNMNTKILKVLFTAVLVFSIYHLVRDILQIFDFHSNFTNVMHRPHLWCKPYCDYVTLPLDILGIVGSAVVLRRNDLGVIGALILMLFPLWLLALILP